MSLVTPENKPFEVVDKLCARFSSRVVLPESIAYREYQRSYWSASQKSRTPWCIFQPLTAQELAQGLRICVETDCRFAVRSGGHGPHAGQSSIDEGVQFDLTKLTTIAIDNARGTATVGAGNTWGPVYSALQAEGVMVVGGRAATVGVGGFILGGGISAYAASKGWSLANVRSFEVALADGRVVVASEVSEEQLYRGLVNGGGSNFGIIASFELELLPYSGIWGGSGVSEESHAFTALDAFMEYVPKVLRDDKAHAFLTFNNDSGPMRVIQHLIYTEPRANMPVFDSFRRLSCTESSFEVTELTSLTTKIAQFQEGDNYRQALSTISFRPDSELLQEVYTIFRAHAEELSSISKSTLEIHLAPTAKRGANPTQPEVYGISEKDGPLIIIAIGLSTEQESFDTVVKATHKSILEQIEARARQLGLHHQFLFMNYASPFQNVIASYGERNVRHLEEVAARYDPEKAFDRLGSGFQIAPRTWE